MLLRRFGKGMEIETPSKVNLFLEVLGRRLDGYHDLDTIMIATSLRDRLQFLPREDDRIKLNVIRMERSNNVQSGLIGGFPQRHEATDVTRVCADPIPTDSTNLVCRALEAVRQVLSVRKGMEIWLHKTVPTQAGLGGGSSDAAAAIVAGLVGWTGQFDSQIAGKIAASLGSDINFFLEGNSGRSWAAICQSRGEHVLPFAVRSPMHMVIAQPPHGCSTAAVFRNLTIPEKKFPFEAVRGALTSGNLSQLNEIVFNRLESAAETQSPWIEKYRNAFSKVNSAAHLLTGSGSARVGLCRSANEAIVTAKRLSTLVPGVVYAVKNWNAPSIEVQLRALGYLCSAR